MVTLADSLVSSSARKLRMRVRRDLTAKDMYYQGRRYWVVKEPIGQNYFRFQEEEYAILQMIDGQSSLDQIKKRFEEEFPPRKIKVEDLQQFVGQLHQSGLIVSNAHGQGKQLKKRRDERVRKQVLGKMSNLLAIQFRGIDPERLLDKMYPFVRFLYHRATVIMSLALMLAALLLVAVQFEVFQSRLPGFHQFFGPDNWLMLGIALGVTKIIHEFGHGLTCKHFGGECHEIGVMLLVLTPCLYCNVSDSWLLPNKWHRAAIGVAGIYIEVLMAAIATFIWWFTEPGTLNHLALSTMFVASISTILFNGNPLLRYDGYYILADIVEIPNLRQKASSLLSRKAGSLMLGLEEPDDPFLPQRNHGFFISYSIAAAVYRWFVLAMILMFLNKVFEPYGLKVIGQMLALMSLIGLVVIPLYKMGKFFYVPGRLEKVKKPRLAASLAVIALILCAIVFIPLPHHVMSPFEVQVADGASVYVEVPGRLQAIHVEPGDYVEQGTPLAELENLDVLITLAELQGQHKATETRLETLNRTVHESPVARGELERVQEDSLSLVDQLVEKQQEAKKLTVVAPVSGTVIPARSVKSQKQQGGQLPKWSGSPLDESNVGAYLDQSVKLCEIGDPSRLEGNLIVTQDDIEFVISSVGEGRTVELMFEQRPGKTYTSKIEEFSQIKMQGTPESLSNKAGGEVPTMTDESGREVPMTISYEATVPLPEAVRGLRVGSSGIAKIHTRPQTLGQRFWRYLTRTFNFHL